MIKSTLDIGFRYFWCDYICIDQNNLKDKEEQIYKMDKYFSEANIVIAMVTDVELKVYESHEEYIHNHIIEIGKSKWMSRIWALQEGRLARFCILACKHKWINKDELLTERYIKHPAFSETLISLYNSNKK